MSMRTEISEDMVVLDALIEIQAEQVHDLVVRWILRKLMGR